MDRVDRLQLHVEALEQQTEQLKQHTQALEANTCIVKRQLRWWRGVACSLVVLAVLTWALPVVTADDAKKDLEQRVAALEKLLKHFRRDGNEVTIKGANLHIVNSLGSTTCTDEKGNEIPDCPNGLGNLIVGYNESRKPIISGGEDIRTGSHNVVVGQGHNFSSYGGTVIGRINTISAPFASITAGQENTASGFGSSISGGYLHESIGEFTAISGGTDNTASGHGASVSGGEGGRALGQWSSVSGGEGNTASGLLAAVSGGEGNTASGEKSSVSGGDHNTASGEFSSVSGGVDVTQESERGWSAGSFGDDISGRFRSP